MKFKVENEYKVGDVYETFEPLESEVSADGLQIV